MVAQQLQQLKADIASARGRALLLETVAAAWGEGRAAAPQSDWKANRLWPQPPESMATLRKDTHAAVLAACGCSPAMFDDSDGTSKREAQRVFLHGTVRPLGKLLAAENAASSRFRSNWGAIVLVRIERRIEVNQVYRLAVHARMRSRLSPVHRVRFNQVRLCHAFSAVKEILTTSPLSGS